MKGMHQTDLYHCVGKSSEDERHAKRREVQHSFTGKPIYLGCSSILLRKSALSVQCFSALFNFGRNPIGPNALRNQNSERTSIGDAATVIVIINGGEPIKLVSLNFGSSQVSEQNGVECSSRFSRRGLHFILTLNNFQSSGSFLLVETVEVHKSYEKYDSNRHKMPWHWLNPKMNAANYPENAPHRVRPATVQTTKEHFCDEEGSSHKRDGCPRGSP